MSRTANSPKTPELAPVSADGVDFTLPSWVYSHYEFFQLEAAAIFSSAWQVACHLNEIPNPGDFITFDMLNERALVIRGEDGAPRAFHNVCAHRAHALVEGHQGHCPGFLTCPYHGWTYHLDGRNRAVSAPQSFGSLDRTPLGLKPIELEVFMGFVFIRFESGGPSVAKRWAPYREELAAYRLEDLKPLGEMWEEPHDIDWKNIVENYVEDYHFATGHPGLSALMERDYDREVTSAGAMRLSHRMLKAPRRSWSARHYARILPDFAHLPDEQNRRWTYFGLFPNVYFDVFPDYMDTFQVIPVGPGKSLLRSQAYALPDDSRATKAARFLSLRINTQVQDEDNALTASVQQGLASSGYAYGVLSEKEIVLKGFQDWLRARIPAARLADAPEPGTLARHNATLKERLSDPE